MIFEGWKPDDKSVTPLYLQIYERIKQEIFSGKLPIGALLPTQRLMAIEFGVNRSTIVTAIELLVSDDLIHSNGKAGTFVKNNASSLNSPAPPNWAGYIQLGSHKPNNSIARIINDNEHRNDIFALTRPDLSKDLYLPELFNEVNSIDIFNSLSYEEPKGNLELRESLCCYYSGIGVKVNPDQILITSGALQALYLIAIGILYEGSTILTETQSYIYSVNTFQSANMRLFGVNADARGILPESLEKAHIRTKAAILYSIPNFNNPTGTLMDEERKKKIYQLCQLRKLPIIEDDTYRELYLTENRPFPLKSLDTNELILLVGSCSKVLFPGFRLGWVLGTKAIIDRLADIKTQTDLGTSSLSQNTFCYMLKNGLYTKHLSYVRKGLKERRNFVLDILKQNFSGLCKWNIPNGSVYIMLEFDSKVSVQKLFHECLNKGLLICTGDLYTSRSSQAIRISYSYLSMTELEKSLKILKMCLLECKRRGL